MFELATRVPSSFFFFRYCTHRFLANRAGDDVAPEKSIERAFENSQDGYTKTTAAIIVVENDTWNMNHNLGMF